MMVKNRKLELVYNVLFYILMGAIGLTMVFPLFWMLLSSFRDAADISMTPKTLDWRNYLEIWRSTNILRYTLNSLFVSLFVVVCQLITSAMAAYAFSRLRFKGRDLIFFLYISTMMVPHMVVLVPRFILFKQLGMLDSYWVLILPPAFSAYGTFMLRQFFLGIDRELEEAAIIDGCGNWRIFINVILPLSRPALATLGIFTFLSSWRSFVDPLIFTDSERVRVLSLGIYTIKASADSIDWGLLMTASVIMILPMILVFIFGQKYFMEGIRMGGVKG